MHNFYIHHHLNKVSVSAQILYLLTETLNVIFQILTSLIKFILVTLHYIHKKRTQSINCFLQDVPYE